MNKKKPSPLLQPALFNIDSPPVKLVDVLPPRQEPLSKSTPEQSGQPVSTLAEVSPPQNETPERSDNLPSEHYPYKSKGMPDAEAMHPSQWVAPKERAPHWWHWVRSKPPLKVVIQEKKKTREVFVKIKDKEPYTPSLAVRRRSIPAITCSLYYTAWGCEQQKELWERSDRANLKANRAFFEADTTKVERLIKLLVFCEVSEEAARNLAREAWQDAKEGIYRRWSNRGEYQGIGRWKIEALGYVLGDQEDDGYGDTEAAAFVEFAVKEGVKGR